MFRVWLSPDEGSRAVNAHTHAPALPVRTPERGCCSNLPLSSCVTAGSASVSLSLRWSPQRLKRLRLREET